MQLGRSTRRNFVKNSMAAAASAPLFWRRCYAGDESANDRLNVGAIGTSIYSNRYTGEGEEPGRGATIGHQAAQLGNLLAVADVNLRHARFFAKEYGHCEVYQDYRRLLDRSDIDVVTIGTPDHWHVKIAIDAMQSGKDVYCEKPLTLTIDEGKRIRKVVKDTGRVLQVGTQQRSEFGLAFLKAVVLARSGRLGDKLSVLCSVGKSQKGGPFENTVPPSELDWDFWLGQAPDVPYCPERCNYDFRWWLEYSGGQITDWGVHHADIAVWALGVEDTGPVEIAGNGKFSNVENGYNVAVEFDCKARYSSGHEIRLYSGANELIISGERGRIRVNRSGLTGAPVEELTDSDNDRIQDEIIALCHGKQPGNHMRNFFECVRDRGKPISDVWSHHRSVSVCHLANIAMQLDRRLEWNPDAERFVADDQANAMLSRRQREPYTL